MGASTAMAQDATAPRGKRAAISCWAWAPSALPTNGGNVGVIGGTPQASNAASPLLDGTYFFTPNLAINLIAATTRHQVSVQNSAIGTVNLGTARCRRP